VSKNKPPRKRAKRPIGIVCWGPIETLSNGYFIRVYSLTEAISKHLRRPVIVVEYDEQNLQKPYSKEILKDVYAILVHVPGNEKYLHITLARYPRFVLYQIINTIRLVKLFTNLDAVIIGGELFVVSSLLLKLLTKDTAIIADPHMLLSEREHRRGRKLISYILKILEKIYFRMSDYIIAISNDMKYKITSIFNINSKKIIVIPHMLPSHLSEISEKKTCNERIQERTNDVKLAFVGTFEANQNLEAAIFLILTLSIILSIIKKNIKLLLIGKISDTKRKLLKDIATRLGVSKNVEITGYVDHLDNILCNADILLAPMFTMSGVSTKMLYYLRFKNKIILASREAIEGLGYLIRKHGNVVVAEDPTDFVIKLARVIKNVKDKN